MRSFSVERAGHTNCVVEGAAWLPVRRRGGEKIERAMDDRFDRPE